MGHRALVQLCEAQGSGAALAPQGAASKDPRLRDRHERTLAHGAGLAPATLGSLAAEGTRELALRVRSVRQSCGVALGAKAAAIARAPDREPMTRVLPAHQAYERWAESFDTSASPIVALESRHLERVLT